MQLSGIFPLPLRESLLEDNTNFVLKAKDNWATKWSRPGTLNHYSEGNCRQSRTPSDLCKRDLKKTKLPLRLNYCVLFGTTATLSVAEITPLETVFSSSWALVLISFLTSQSLTCSLSSVLVSSDENASQFMGSESKSFVLPTLLKAWF